MEHCVYTVKIDTIMEYPLHYNPHYNGVRRPERETLMPYHSRSRTDANRREGNRKESLVTSPNKKRCTLHLV